MALPQRDVKTEWAAAHGEPGRYFFSAPVK